MEEKLAGPHSSHKFGVRRIAIPLESASCVCLLGVPGACVCCMGFLLYRLRALSAQDSRGCLREVLGRCSRVVFRLGQLCDRESVCPYVVHILSSDNSIPRTSQAPSFQEILGWSLRERFLGLGRGASRELPDRELPAPPICPCGCDPQFPHRPGWY